MKIWQSSDSLFHAFDKKEASFDTVLIVTPHYTPGSWKATWDGDGGGVVLNQCPHNIDLLQWICGMPIKVQAFL